MTMHVVIPQKEDVADFVTRVSKIPCDVDLSTGVFSIDAKSLIGVLGLGVGKPLKLEVCDDYENSVKTELQKYMIS